MEYCLKELKDALYRNENPILYFSSTIYQDEGAFLEQYFPADFYGGSFSCEGKQLSLATILSRSSGSTSQRNKVFNRKYYGVALMDRTVKILNAYPEIWNALCASCKREILTAGDDSRLRKYLRSKVEIIASGDYRQYVSERIDSAPELALAASILYLLLQGSQDADGLLELFQATQGYESQFHYMEPAERMMKRNLLPIVGKHCTDDEFRRCYDGYAELLGPVTTLKKNGVIVSFRNLLSELYDALTSAEETRLLHISGAGGAEKNAVTELLYLRMASEVKIGAQNGLAPFYINLNYYRGTNETRDAAVAAMDQDLRGFWSYTTVHPERKPIVFIDGIKNYAIDDFELDYYLSKCMREHVPDAGLVIATESAVVMNQSRQRVLPDFANGRFLYEASIESVNLLNREQSEQYFAAFKKLYGGESGPIYRKLRDLGFVYADTDQIRLLRPSLESAKNISDLYEAVSKACLSGSSEEELDALTNWTYQFAYTDKKPKPISARLKQLVTAHDSFQNFFLARWYVSRLRCGTAEEKIRDLDMVLPKAVTGFVAPMLASDSSLESNLIDFIERNYSQLSLLAKSQMNYWLGRIQSPRLADLAEDLLERNYREVRLDLSNPDAANDPEYEQKLFLMRGITVSLIVKGYQDYSDEYLALLIHNPVANEINRGFHLEYYGDKTYMPTTRGDLNLMDNITTGKRTLDRLFATTSAYLSGESMDPLFDLNLFTICSLLQARIENTNTDIEFDIIPYLTLACGQIDAYLALPFEYNDEMYRNYLRMAKRDFESRIRDRDKPWSYIGAEVFGEYNRRVVRTGWAERGIPNPESVAEHTYSMWLIGTMFLQDSYPRLTGYSKNEVLSMIMIHDLAETKTGDIPTPTKNLDRNRYDEEERREMEIFLLRESYPNHSCQQHNYEIWQKWNDRKNINARIAREIDKIQLMYQALRYKLEYPETMTDELLRDMMGSARMIITMPGKKIYNALIRNNNAFREALERINMYGDSRNG